MKSSTYEDPSVLSEYLAFHYLEPADLLPKGVPVPRGLTNFPKACAHLLLSRSEGRPTRALDLGCAVGRSSFEMAKKIREVIGIDFSRTFIRTAKQLQKTGKIRFPLLEEGHEKKLSLARIPPPIDRNRVRFHLIDRLPEPLRFLKQALPRLVRPGGTLLLTSPYTWSTAFTPKTRWLNDSFATIQKALRPHFRLLHRQDLPFLLREHRRKFQYTFADATLWQKT
ncbi:methyltransferase domain-containing protein [bacterium]|nr:methyltransferase domain-containing protein [bacterium]